MKVAFCIPSTSRNRNWARFEDSYLTNLKSLRTKHEVDFFIGFDADDNLYKNQDVRDSFNAKWLECNFEKGHVTLIWDHLYKVAIKEGKYDYFWLAGDDIEYCEKDWLETLIQSLQTTNDLGIAGMFNGNPNLPMTQFLVSKKHFDLFGFAFPLELKNWYCDNWIQEIYPRKYVHYHPEFQCLNAGGEPRYLPSIDRGEWRELLKKYSKNVKHL